jgi:hypothetical protein
MEFHSGISYGFDEIYNGRTWKNHVVEPLGSSNMSSWEISALMEVYSWENH